MPETILFQHKIVESEGFDSHAQPVQAGEPRAGQPTHNPTTPPMATNGQDSATVTTDIAQTAPNVLFTKNAISLSLPYMLSYVQPLNGPSGFVFGLQQKDKTKIPDTYDDPTIPTRVTPGTNPGDDIVVMRQFVETKVREVTLDLTNETAEDIQKLFGENFPKNYDLFIQSGGELWDGPNGPLARFFLSMAQQRITSKINKDFTDWLGTMATPAGSATLNGWDEMNKLIGIIAELREKLFLQTGKSGQLWLLTTPKIANFLATFYQRQHNDAITFNKGKKIPNNFENGYICTIGDVEVYQYNFTGTSEKMFVGYRGSAGVSSLYYYPYSEYIIQGGEDYFTGQSNVYYRVRDIWSTNPLDTFGGNLTEPALGTPTNPIPQNLSNFIVSADVTISNPILT